jgi:hypothetical protein
MAVLVMRLGLFLLFVSCAACGAPLVRARIDPAPGSAAGGLRLRVPEVAFAAEVAAPHPTAPLEAADELVLAVDLENAGAGPVQVDLGHWALEVTGAGGRAQRAAALRWYDARPATVGTPSRAHPPGRQAIEGGGRRVLWIAFAGPEGLPRTGPLAIRLVAPEAGAPLVLAAPAAPGPTWEATTRLSGSLALRTGLWGGPGYGLFEAGGFEVLLGWRRLVFGYAVSGGTVRPNGEGARDLSSFGAGARVGWVFERVPIGLLAGADARSAGEEGDPDGEGPEHALRSLSLTVRYLPTTPRASLALVPTPPRTSPFGPVYLELGYVRWFGDGPLASGNGLLLATGVAWVTP